ncbi:hypothetical protein BJF79_14310 [Actinomadura sp. CNU-125]|uniref:hypothetical protein n=1 Tax=Actinomadura sp. CNU-125 TaxID=1904961 RepID=UPI000967072C|nr:hypothetical protein [Actinomadura sp. CNU-125]OLT23916.1 hypothetical protein BJF79_14310 [Actinomadura sp. CNU-125]
MVDIPAAPDGVMRGLGDLCPGWCTERVGGRLVARRVERLSDYQFGHGCLDEVTAGSVTELLLVCEAQNTLAERIAVAETTARGVCGPVS